jgi:hypothetical protein
MENFLRAHAALRPDVMAGLALMARSGWKLG